MKYYDKMWTSSGNTRISNNAEVACAYFGQSSLALLFNNSLSYGAISLFHRGTKPNLKPIRKISIYFP